MVSDTPPSEHVVDKLRARGVEVRVFDMVLPTFRKDIEFYQGSLLDFDAFRMSLTGRERGPELWAVLRALPRDEALRRALAH